MIDVTIKVLYKYPVYKICGGHFEKWLPLSTVTKFIVIKLCLPSSNESENYRLQEGINVSFIDRVVAKTFSNMEVCSPGKIIRP